MASKKQDVSSLEFTGIRLLSDPPQYVYESKDGSRVNSFTAPSDDQLQIRSQSLKKGKDKFFREIMRGGMKKKTAEKRKGGAMKAKGMKKGGAMKSKGYANGGALTKEEARSLRKKTGAAMTKKELEKAMKNMGSGAGKAIDSSLSKEDAKKLRDQIKRAQKKMTGGAMKTKGMKKGGAMKSKGYAKGGAMKAKGMAKGGAMKTKGGNKGGVKRNMRPPSSNKSGLYGR